MPSILDLARLELFVQRLDFRIADLSSARRREILREIRANARAAAAEVGMRQALANLGQPRDLAAGYLAAEGRPLPRWMRGGVVAGAVVMAYTWSVLFYAMGVADGSQATDPSGAEVTSSFLGTTIHTATGPSSLSIEASFSPLLLLVPLVLFVVVSRLWRVLPGARRTTPERTI